MTNRKALREIDTTGANDGDVPTYNATSDQLEYAPAATSYGTPVLLLAAGAAVPSGTPVGTIIMRKA